MTLTYKQCRQAIDLFDRAEQEFAISIKRAMTGLERVAAGRSHVYLMGNDNKTRVLELLDSVHTYTLLLEAPSTMSRLLADIEEFQKANTPEESTE